jgi:hypothetical protein
VHLLKLAAYLTHRRFCVAQPVSIDGGLAPLRPQTCAESRFHRLLQRPHFPTDRPKFRFLALAIQRSDIVLKLLSQQGMGMDFLADTRLLDGLFAGVPGGLGADVTITGMRAATGK